MFQIILGEVLCQQLACSRHPLSTRSLSPLWEISGALSVKGLSTTGRCLSPLFLWPLGQLGLRPRPLQPVGGGDFWSLLRSLLIGF